MDKENFEILTRTLKNAGYNNLMFLNQVLKLNEEGVSLQKQEILDFENTHGYKMTTENLREIYEICSKEKNKKTLKNYLLKAYCNNLDIEIIKKYGDTKKNIANLYRLLEYNFPKELIKEYSQKNTNFSQLFERFMYLKLRPLDKDVYHEALMNKDIYSTIEKHNCIDKNWSIKQVTQLCIVDKHCKYLSKSIEDAIINNEYKDLPLNVLVFGYEHEIKKCLELSKKEIDYSFLYDEKYKYFSYRYNYLCKLELGYKKEDLEKILELEIKASKNAIRHVCFVDFYSETLTEKDLEIMYKADISLEDQNIKKMVFSKIIDTHDYNWNFDFLRKQSIQSAIIYISNKEHEHIDKIIKIIGNNLIKPILFDYIKNNFDINEYEKIKDSKYSLYFYMCKKNGINIIPYLEYEVDKLELVVSILEKNKDVKILPKEYKKDYFTYQRNLLDFNIDINDYIKENSLYKIEIFYHAKTIGISLEQFMTNKYNDTQLFVAYLITLHNSKNKVHLNVEDFMDYSKKQMKQIIMAKEQELDYKKLCNPDLSLEEMDNIRCNMIRQKNKSLDDLLKKEINETFNYHIENKDER